MSLPDFPVDDATLLAVEHALNACLARDGVDDDGNDNWKIIGADYDLAKLLEFLSGYDKSKEVPYVDEDGHEVPDFIEYKGGPVYHPDDVIRSLIAEVRRLRMELGVQYQ